MSKGGWRSMGILYYLTPIIAIIFFVNCVSLTRKIQKGDENTANNTFWGAIMFGYIVFSIMVFASLS
jgi:hypothetical protein